jgi:hypothetical protein
MLNCGKPINNHYMGKLLAFMTTNDIVCDECFEYIKIKKDNPENIKYYLLPDINNNILVPKKIQYKIFNSYSEYKEYLNETTSYTEDIKSEWNNLMNDLESIKRGD